MIRNATRGTRLCENYELAESAWKRVRGLMFRKGLPGSGGLLMAFGEESPAGIWMLGMRFPIDIVFLDSRKEVLRVVESARPMGLSWRTWKVYHPPVPARFVLELPAGTVEKSRTRVGDVLEF